MFGKCPLAARFVSNVGKACSRYEMTVLDVFSVEVQQRLSLHVTAAAWTVAASASTNGGTGTWKEVDVAETVQLVREFGCRFVRFRLTDDIPEQIIYVRSNRRMKQLMDWLSNSH